MLKYQKYKQLLFFTGNVQYIILLILPVWSILHRLFPNIFDNAVLNNFQQLLEFLLNWRPINPHWINPRPDPPPINPQLMNRRPDPAPNNPPPLRRSNRLKRQVERLNL